MHIPVITLRRASGAQQDLTEEKVAMNKKKKPTHVHTKIYINENCYTSSMLTHKWAMLEKFTDVFLFFPPWCWYNETVA